MKASTNQVSMDYREHFIVKPGTRINLSEIDPGFKDKAIEKSDADRITKADEEVLHRLQYRLFAEHQHSLLIVLQGLDASGKDGTISHVFSMLNPQGARVHAFKQPSPQELDHDFLWRCHAAAPARGELVIFNRSQYEDVLIVRVHDLVPRSVWSKRYELINGFEKDLAENGTTILKFFLHISPAEQLKRFKARLDDPSRWWKISEADYTERAYFDDYMRAYEDVFEQTSTPYAPWFVIPADHKWFRNVAISKIVAGALESLDLQLPKPAVDIDDIRRKYHDAKIGA
jgi:PPK2 family polyphosphate:nucleotide phosphotransferase